MEQALRVSTPEADGHLIGEQVGPFCIRVFVLQSIALDIVAGIDVEGVTAHLLSFSHRSLKFRIAPVVVEEG